MSSIKPIYLLFLTAGFTVGFGHCIGMCGPIVVSFSLNLEGKNNVFPHILYNCGRIVTYAVLGAVMGATGSFTRVTAHIASIQKAMMIFAGLFIVFMGFAMVGSLPFSRIFKGEYRPGGIIARGFKTLLSVKSTVAYFPLGLLLGLLPCGPVYTALIAAARSGMEATTSWKGAATGTGLMMAFGLGTVPALFVVAKLSIMGWLRSRELIYKIGAAVMIIVGVYFIIKGIRY
jgi:sulfite exporter TauE/SafE